MPKKKFKVKAHCRVNPRTRTSEVVTADSKAQIRSKVRREHPKLVIDSITQVK